MAWVASVCRVFGPRPAAFIRAFDPARDGEPIRPLVHRWTRGHDLVALLWMLRRTLEDPGYAEPGVARAKTTARSSGSSRPASIRPPRMSAKPSNAFPHAPGRSTSARRTAAYR